MTQQQKILNLGYQISDLISVSLNVRTLDDNRDFEYDDIYELCQKHGITALVAYAIEPLLVNEEYLKWKKSLKFSQMHTASFDAEREEILAFLKSNNIWYMPMKGLVLRKLYPQPFLREMCDNDILYDSNGYELLKKFMIERGYSIEFTNKISHVDEYHMPPFYNFEMHKNFFMANQDLWVDYYSDMNKFLIQNSNDPFEYHMSDEDFYVYFVLHSYKHYIQAGTGLRTLVDCFIYNQKKGNKLNWNYINEQLFKLEILSFENELKTISEKLFLTKEKLTLEQEQIFLYILSSGAYGTIKNKLKNNIKNAKKSKFKYMLRRIFPDMQWYKGNAQFCYKHKWAIPFYCIYRIIDRFIRHGKQIFKEIKMIGRMK